jgi:hypothetical protein
MLALSSELGPARFEGLPAKFLNFATDVDIESDDLIAQIFVPPLEFVQFGPKMPFGR